MRQNAWGVWHADISWPPSELIRLWVHSVDFPALALFWLSETGQSLGFRKFFFRSQRMNGLKFAMLMYPDHIENWVVCGDVFPPFGSILILMKLVQFHVSWHFLWILASWYVLTTFKTDSILVMVCWYSSFWHPFDWLKLVKFEVSHAFPWENIGIMARNVACWCILTTFRTN